MFYKDERLALVFDGTNFFNTAKAINLDIDFKILLTEFSRRGRLVCAMYYMMVSETDDFSPARRMADWLDYNGFRLFTKVTKEFTDPSGYRRFKGDTDVELAVDTMEIAPHIDHLVLFSGNGKFSHLVDAMQRKGIRVSVCSSIRTQPAMISDDLRRHADNFIELDALRPIIARNAASVDATTASPTSKA